MTTAPRQLQSTCHRGFSFVVKIDSHSREVFSCALFSLLVAQNIGQSMTAMSAQAGSSGMGAPSAIVCNLKRGRLDCICSKHSGLQAAAKVGVYYVRSGGNLVDRLRALMRPFHFIFCSPFALLASISALFSASVAAFVSTCIEYSSLVLTPRADMI